MKSLHPASRLLEADIDHLLDSAEDPEVMIRQLVHDMDEAVSELRRETVNAVARQKQLEQKTRTTEELDAATALAQQIKSDLLRMMKQAELARRKRNELIRRKRVAEVELRTGEAARGTAEAFSDAAVS